MLRTLLERLLLLGVLVIPACAPAVDDPSTSSDDIVEGEIADGAADRSIVAVISPNKPSWICSGALIAPRVVLTAAHCVKGGNSDKTGWSFKVFFGTDRENKTSEDETIDVASFHYPDLYWTGDDGEVSSESPTPRSPTTKKAPSAKADKVDLDEDTDNENSETRPAFDDSDGDIAVLILDKPASAKPMRWNRKPVASSVVGDAIRVVGYGRTGPNKSGTNGVRRASSLTIEAVTPGTIAFSAGRDNPCNGDSGGPMLLKRNGVETIFAVGHVVWNADTCTDGGNYTRTDRYADFIDKYLDENP